MKIKIICKNDVDFFFFFFRPKILFSPPKLACFDSVFFPPVPEVPERLNTLVNLIVGCCSHGVPLAPRHRFHCNNMPISAVTRGSNAFVTRPLTGKDSVKPI